MKHQYINQFEEDHISEHLESEGASKDEIEVECNNEQTQNKEDF